MKIAYLSSFYPFRGGAAQFNANLYNALKKNNEVRAFNFTTQYPKLIFPGTSQYVQSDDIAEPIDSEAILSTVNPFSYISAANKILRYAPDITLVRFWMPFFAPSVGSVLRLLKNKTRRVAIIDNVIPHERRLGDIQLIKYFLGSADAFVVMSSSVRDELLSFKPNALYKEAVFPFYSHFGERVDSSVARKRLGIANDKKLLLFFGLIRDYKGLDNLIEAMSLLGNDYHLLIGGEVYDSYDKYDAIVKRYNLGDRVHFHNRYIADSEVVDFFCASDVCVLPYKSATQSAAVGTSYQFDLPVIVSDTGGLRAMVDPYGSGIVIEKSDPLLIARAVEEYFSSDINVFRSNINNYKRVATWDNLANIVVGL